MLWWFAQTTLIAGALAVVATLAGRWKRLGAEARHGLWLIVLIKLALPPLVAWPWQVPDRWPSRVEPAPVALPVALPPPPQPPPVVAAKVAPPVPKVEPPAEFKPFPAPRFEIQTPPAVGPPPSPEAVLAQRPVEPSIVADSPMDREIDLEIPPPTTLISEPEPAVELPEVKVENPSIGNPQVVILGLWLVGSLVVVVRRVLKVARFHRSLSDTVPAPGWLVEETQAIGDRVGVRPPPVVMTPKVITPLLWCLGFPRLILPEGLVQRLAVDRWPGILAHELAHLARRDHWVVRLELLLEAVWWWNPLFWHVRRKLHEEAELACDAQVVRSLPDRRFDYAEALVDVCEHLARGATPSPALGVGGAGASRSLEGRLLMILRDPIPRQPSRWAALFALLLAALALPSWTLGRQEPEKPKVAAPVAAEAPPQKPAEPKPSAPQPLPPGFMVSKEASEATVATIQNALRRKQETLKNLSFRYVVAIRERRPLQTDEMYNASQFIANPNPAFPNAVVPNNQPSEPEVRVKVADVILGNEGSRVDLLDALVENQTPGVPKDFRWGRQFVAKHGEGTMALGMAWNSAGPVPFRWLAGPRLFGYGDTLSGEMSVQQPVLSFDPETTLDPLDPRPANLLDLAGASSFFVSPEAGFTKAEVAGVDLIDGREAVRVAWIGTREGLRGICWYVPKLDFALVRFDATLDPNANQIPSQGRLNWRKSASDFIQVGDHWLPGKVTYEESKVDPNGGEPIRRKELKIAFEDLKTLAEPPAGAFRPRMAVQGLDDQTGQFTALPPEVPAGLVARLKKAVEESPFGPPREAKLIQTEPAAFDPSPVQPAPVVPANPPAQVPMPGPNPDAVMIVPPKPGVDDPDPVVVPKPVEPVVNAAERPRKIDPEIERRFKADPEVAALVKEMASAENKYQTTRRLALNPTEPAIRAARLRLDALKTKYEQLWAKRADEFRKPALEEEVAQARDSVEILQARRNRKAAELQGAEAKKRIADAALSHSVALRKQGVHGQDEVDKAEMEQSIAEAEVNARKADLEEADLLVKQARRSMEGKDIAEVPGPVQGPVPGPPGEAADPVKPQPPRDAEASKAPEPIASSTLPELRDAVELLEVQLLGKQAELRGAEMKLQVAGTKQGDRALAKAEIDQKKIEVQEYEIRIKQARRRVEAEEARLKRDIERARARLEWSEKMVKQGLVSKATHDADQKTYDDLMLQLDPKSVPPEIPKPPVNPGSLPAIGVKLTGDKVRLSGQTSEYQLKVSNPGTEALTKVKVVVTLPREGGKLLELPKPAKFSVSDRKLSWTIARIEPGQSFDLSFIYKVSAPGFYRAQVEVNCEQGKVARDEFSTEVQAIHALDLQMGQKQRIIDVGNSTFYEIKIKNLGTKDATRLRLYGKLTKNLKILKHFGGKDGEFRFQPETGEFAFPDIDKLGPGEEITLSLEVQALENGPAGCHVFLNYREMEADEPGLEGVVSTTVLKPK